MQRRDFVHSLLLSLLPCALTGRLQAAPAAEVSARLVNLQGWVLREDDV